MLGGIICAVHKVTDSYNLGIACYMIVQMFLVAGCFTYLILWLRRKKVSKAVCLPALIYLPSFR